MSQSISIQTLKAKFYNSATMTHESFGRGEKRRRRQGLFKEELTETFMGQVICTSCRKHNTSNSQEITVAWLLVVVHGYIQLQCKLYNIKSFVSNANGWLWYKTPALNWTLSSLNLQTVWGVSLASHTFNNRTMCTALSDSVLLSQNPSENMKKQPVPCHTLWHAWWV